jgi:orotate phosphoribosyltransferase
MIGFNKEQFGKEIVCALYDEGMIETWYRDKPEGWTLVSGIWSPFYINLRPLGSKQNSKEILSKIGSAMGGLIKEEMPYITRVVGLYIAGIPLASAITLTVGIPSCYGRQLPGIKTEEEFKRKITELRQQLHKYGQHGLVEGDFCEGDQIAIIDDLVTKFNTKLLARIQIDEAAKDKNVHVTCKDVVVLIDREQGAREVALSSGMRLWSVIPFKSKGIHWLKDRMEPQEFETITDYLKDEKKYQEPAIQRKLLDAALKK